MVPEGASYIESLEKGSDDRAMLGIAREMNAVGIWVDSAHVSGYGRDMAQLRVVPMEG